MRFPNLAIAFLVTILTSLLAVETVGQIVEKSEDLAAAKAAWQHRHDKVRSLRATLDEENTTHRAYYRALMKPGKDQAIPDKDYLVRFSSNVSIRDSSFRYSYVGKRWSQDTRHMDPIDYTAISTPDVRSFFNRRPDSNQPPTLSLSSRPTSDESALSLAPLMLAIRSGLPSQKKLKDYTPTGKTVIVEGVACLEVSSGSRKEGTVEYLYLDPKADWTVRQIAAYTGDKLSLQVKVQYTQYPVAGWLPSNWSYVTRASNGDPLSSGKVLVKHYEINVEIPEEEFHPSYPAGTFVVDDTKGTGNETVSVIKDDGTSGVAVPLGQRPSYEQLVEANRSVQRQWTWLLILGGMVLILAVVAILRYRQRVIRRLKGGSTPAE